MKSGAGLFASVFGVLASQLMFSAGTFAEVRTQIHFVDRCSKKPISVKAGQKVSVAIKIEGLTRRDPVRLTLVTGPKGYTDQGQQVVLQRQKGKKLTPDETGTVYFEKWIRVPKVDPIMASHPEQRMWEARVDWQQDPSAQGPTAGVGFAYLMLMPERSNKIYEIQGSPIQTWYTPFKPISDYKYNSDTGSMQLSRSVAWHESFGRLIDSEMGVSSIALQQGFVGAGPSPTNTAVGGRNGLVIFSGWKHWQRDPRVLHMTRRWRLAAKQGGAFGSRYKFERVPAKELSFINRSKKDGCGTWQYTREGTLDVGSLEVEFHVIPKSHGNSYEKMELFMNLNGLDSQADPSSEVVESDEESEILFNPAK